MCSPHKGSESGKAWNWYSCVAKHCELYIIIVGDFREYIEKALEGFHGSNIRFYYNPVAAKVLEIYWKQGDWRFYKR